MLQRKKRLAWVAGMLLLSGCTTMDAQIRSSGKLGQVDRDYLDTVYQLVQLDNQEGKLAATAATDPRVKVLSAQLVSQANTLYPELQGALKAEGIAEPDHVPPEIAAQVQRLSQLHGAAFDRQYVADELAIHQRALPIFQREAAQTQDGAIRFQVNAQLPVVQQNRDSLRSLAQGFSQPAS